MFVPLELTDSSQDLAVGTIDRFVEFRAAVQGEERSLTLTPPDLAARSIHNSTAPLWSCRTSDRLTIMAPPSSRWVFCSRNKGQA